MSKAKTKKIYNREFQKNEVLKYLIIQEDCKWIDKPLIIPEQVFSPSYDGEECYLNYLYRVKDYKEYIEGFGPSVTVRINNEKTVWKRSRNKWNSFDKIISFFNNDKFDLYSDETGPNSYYVIERMYYYLDKEKHKDKFNSIRAKLYITRVNQKKDWIFLLQFITEYITLEDQENNRRLKQKRINKHYALNIGDINNIDLFNFNTLSRHDEEEINLSRSRSYYSNIMDPNSRSRYPVYFLKPNNNLLPERNLEYYNDISSQTSPNSLYVSPKYSYIKPAPLPLISHPGDILSKLPPLSPSLYLKDFCVSSNETDTKLKQLKRTFYDIEPVAQESCKKRRLNSYGKRGNIIEDEEILKGWFCS